MREQKPGTPADREELRYLLGPRIATEPVPVITGCVRWIAVCRRSACRAAAPVISDANVDADQAADTDYFEDIEVL